MTDNVEQTEIPQEQKQSSRNLTPLFGANGDCIGWICIPNTAVNYPVMYTPKEPQKYLRKNFEGEYSASGVPFLDGNSTPECDNLIIYGHNMKNGTMFSDITQYRDKAYCEEHPSIEFETADGLRIYQVFAVEYVKNNDGWYDFHTAADEVEYNDKVSEISNRALYDTGFIPQYGQQLLTLSTCYGAAKSDRTLPETQRRRLVMYYFDGLTYEEIAERERCTHPAVIKSVKSAISKLKKYFFK